MVCTHFLFDFTILRQVREQTLELAQLRVRLEESTADASRRERQLSILRDELMESKHKVRH